MLPAATWLQKITSCTYTTSDCKVTSTNQVSKPAKPAPCAIHGLLQDLTHPWTLHILYALCHNGPARFSILRRQVEGISSRVLTERLRLLEQKGFVHRKYESTIPPSVTYGVTNRMKDIGKVL